MGEGEVQGVGGSVSMGDLFVFLAFCIVRACVTTCVFGGNSFVRTTPPVSVVSRVPESAISQRKKIIFFLVSPNPQLTSHKSMGFRFDN